MKKLLVAAFMLLVMLPVSAMAITPPPPTLQGTAKSVKMLARTRDGNGVVTSHKLALTAGLSDTNNTKVWVADAATQGFMMFAAEITMAGTGAVGTASNFDIVIGEPSEVMGLGSSSNTLIGQVPAHGSFTYNDVSGPVYVTFAAACDVKAVATVDPVSGMPTKGSVVLKLAPVNVFDGTDTLYLTITIPTVQCLPPL